MPAPTLFRFRYEVLGAHTHVRLFAGKGSLTLGLAGTFVLRNEEFEDLRRELGGPGNIEFVDEGVYDAS